MTDRRAGVEQGARRRALARLAGPGALLAAAGGARGSALPACTNSENRGWLKSGATQGTHPSGQFGPLGLHGEHNLEPLGPAAGGAAPHATLEVTEVGTHAYAKGDIGFTTPTAGSGTPAHWYPGRTYKITVGCQKTCAFLLTAEIGDVGGAASQQVGAWDQTRLSGDSTVKEFKGVVDYVAATNTATKASSYNVYWTAPAFDSAARYAGLTVRATVVVDDGLTCPGYFVEYQLPSLLECGNGRTDPEEECDDGGNEDGDGCSADCRVEKGWTCADRVPGVGMGELMSKCTKAEVQISPLSLSITEGGKASYAVSLSTFIAEGSQVFCIVAPPVQSDFNIVGSKSLMWDHTNYQVAHIVQIASNAEESTVNGNRVYEIGHATYSNGDPNFDDMTPPSVTLTIVDDDAPGLRLVRDQSVRVSESGQTAEYQVRLKASPKEGTTVVVNIAVKDDNGAKSDAVVANPSSLAFTQVDWNQGQRVILQGVDNAIIDGLHGANIVHTVSSSDPSFDGLNVSEVDFKVTVDDNDSAGLVLSVAKMNMAESGTDIVKTYTVSLTSAMIEGTSVSVTLGLSCSQTVLLDGTQQCGLTAQGPLGGALLVFDESNYADPQVVIVRALNNDLEDGSRTFVIRHEVESTDPAYDNLPYDEFPVQVEITVSDDDTSGVNMPSIPALNEGAGPVAFPFSLKSQPFAPVTLVVTLEDESFVELEGATVVFSPDTWAQAKEVTIKQSFFDDLIDSGLRQTNVVVETRSPDPAYQGLDLPKIPVTFLENDAAGVKLDLEKFYANILAVIEGGEPVSVPVSLKTRPQGAYSVELKISHGPQISVAPSKLEFAAADFSSPQMLVVSAVDDTAVEDTKHYDRISVEIKSDDPEYAKLERLDVQVTISDNDPGEAETFVNHLGGVVSPTIPPGAALITVPPGVLPSKGVQLKVAEEEKPPTAGQSRPASACPSCEKDSSRRVSGTYAFTPHGANFSRPVFLTIEYDTASAASVGSGPGAEVELSWYRRSGLPGDPDFVRLEGGAFKDGVATLATTSFSEYFIGAKEVTPPVTGGGEATESEEERSGALAADEMAKCLNGFELRVVDGEAVFQLEEEAPPPPPPPVVVDVCEAAGCCKDASLIDTGSSTFQVLIGVIAAETVIFLAIILALRSRLVAARVGPGQVIKETIIVDGSDGDVLLASP